ncbi:MAG TPA: hypothetical protein PKA06_07720, partial [Gemmatales bacterium]|nr:hypothetical protein [Gemmatales bacterium]
KQGEQSKEESSKNQPGEEGHAGPGAGSNPKDQGKLDDLLKEMAKDSEKQKRPSAPEKEQKPQEITADDARNKELALDSLAEKLRKGEIDRKLADKLKELNLTKEEALKLVNDRKLDRQKSTGKQVDQGPGSALTTRRQRTEQIVDPNNDPPDELSSSYRTFTEKRNQKK